MSEIKGQLLGIILVLMIFTAISGAMVTVFTNLGNTVKNEVSEIVNGPAVEESDSD